jgi:glycosyltransferase
MSVANHSWRLIAVSDLPIEVPGILPGILLSRCCCLQKPDASMKITLITCVLNRKATIAGAIESVRAQTYPDIEHVIVDGGSTDGTLEIVQELTHPGLRIFSGKDGGIYDALNRGIALSTGEVVGLVHSDDWLAHSMVVARVAAAFRDGVHAVYGDIDYVSATDASRVVRHWSAGDFRKGALSQGWMPPHPSLFLLRDELIALGAYDANYTIAADYDLILRLFSQSGFRSRYIPEVLVKMRLGGASNKSLRHILRKSREDYAILRKNGVGGLGSLVLKNLRKLPQFSRRSSQVFRPD